MAQASVSCNRCREPEGFATSVTCSNCGVHEDRPVRRNRRRRPTGGKRGRNSGTTNKAKQK